MSPNPFITAAQSRKVLIGVVHLKPLPGSPRYTGESLESIVATATADANAILEAGLDGWILENFGDSPFFKGAVPSHVIAAMTRIAAALPGENNALRGVNVLRNDAAGALAVAAAAGLDFVRVNVHTGARVTDQGIIEGDAAATLRLRRNIAPDVAILADVDVKHSEPLGQSFDLIESARETAHRGLADALIVTGRATGSPIAFDQLKAVRGAVSDRSILAGSGVTPHNVRDALSAADGAIVGTWLKRGGRIDDRVDLARARELVTEARRT